jgi:hypothetical protein
MRHHRGMLYIHRPSARTIVAGSDSDHRPLSQTERPRPIRENLAKVRVLYRSPDTLGLWGICYEMRADCGQQPKDIAQDLRGDWIWIGQPGWWGTMTREEIDATRAFLAEHTDEIPNGPNEWTTLAKKEG